MRSEGCQTSEPLLQAHRRVVASPNESPRLASDSGNRSPVSPLWSPVSPYFSGPVVTVSPIITVSFSEPSASDSSPVIHSSQSSSSSSRVIPESPLPQTLGTHAPTSAAPLAFSTGDGETPDDTVRNVWNFIIEQLRQEGWQTINPNNLPSPATALPSFSSAFNNTH